MIHCPFCRHEMNLKGAHPGKFSPKCPACGEKFGLIIPEDPAAQPTVVKLAHHHHSHPKNEVVEKVDPTIANALGIEITPPPVHAKRPARANVVAPKPAAAPQRPAVAHAESRQVSAAGASATLAPSPAPPVSHGGSSVATMPPAEKLPEAAAALSPVNRDIPPVPAPDASASIPASMPQAPAPAAAPASGANEELNLSGRLGGYDIIQKLGRGGMGAVYLARQVSLDRNVAVKVLHPRFASDPQFVARFTREAYAAAHLVHHNVVQIHDIGAEKDVHYYSMEFVEGQTLNQVVHKDGRLDPEVAVGHVLQAARGLKFAHEHGMIHRDIKPDNLMLNDQGIVKVADLGLVKTPAAVEESSSNGANGPHAAHSMDLAATMAGVAMGTPAFMSPEQCADATKVDQRADIYSLGCTLYDLLTGRPPFSGKTAVEVMTKHQREDAVPPERLAKHVPERLSKIVMKMMAKRPEERYPTMNEVIRDLEEFLGVNSTGPFTPKEEHVERLEASVKWFNDSSMAKLRPKLIAAFFALCVLAIAATAAMGRPLLAGGLVGFMLLTAASYVVVTGITQRTALFLKLRQLVFGARIVDWLKWIGIGAMAVAILFILDLLWIWAAFCVAAVGVAAAFHFTIDRLSAKQRQQPVHNVEMMLKQMRVKGLPEDALRQFVCKYGGERWEEFYETLFGYEAKLTARTHWGKSDRGRARKKFAAWRDPVIAWIDHRIQARKEAAERRHLQKIEAKAMRAKGVSEKQAAKAAARKAEKMVEQAAHLRETMDKRAAVTIGPSIATSAIATALKNVPAPAAALGSPPNVSLRSIIDDAEAAEDEGKVDGRQRGSYFSRRFGGPLDWLFGPQTRLLLAIVVLAGFMLWRYQNKQSLIEEIDVRGSRLDAVDTVALDPSKAIQTQRDVEYEAAKAQKLEMKGVPSIASNLASSYNAGVAGAMLLLSTLFRGRILGLLVILAAALTLAGHLYELPAVGYLHRSITLLAGLGLTIFAWIFFRQK